MSKFTVKKSDNFTILPNNILKNKDMSLKAIGLLCKMLSLPEDWDYSVEGLCRICKEGQTAINAALKELKDNRYLVVRKLNPRESGKGIFVYEYCVYEEPQYAEDDNGCSEDEVQKDLDSSTRFQGGGNLPLENLPLNKVNKDKERKQDRVSPATPTKLPSHSGKLFDTKKTPKKSSIQKTNSFITMCERVSAKFNFSQELLKELGNYFRMLGASGSLLPEQSIEEQMKILASVRERDRVGVVKDTVGHGWKSLQYLAKECKEGSTPSWDTARPDAFRAKTMEEKRRNPLEGVPEEDIF